MWNNTRETYGWISIALHWLVALMVFGLFGLGLYMVDLSYYDSWYKGSVALHKSLGISLALLLSLRILWRIASAQPESLLAASKKLQRQLALWALRLLYALLLTLLVSGYMISTADGRAIAVFDWFEIPALPWQFTRQENLAGDVHFYLAWSLISLVALHALAALKHHFFDRDNTLKRMLSPRKH